MSGAANQSPLARLRRLAKEVAGPGADVTLGDRAFLLAERLVWAGRLSPRVAVGRRRIFELRTPPRPFRGLRDLAIRRGELADLDALAAIDHTDPELVRLRFRRGDLCYVAQSGERVIAHTWFHPGPTSFDEDEPTCVRWALGPSTFWSYNGAAIADARSSGAFVKLFQVALAEVFEKHGAARVQGFIHDSNEASITMHRRLGWSELGTLQSVVVPGLRWLRWEADGRARQWLLPRSADFALPLPPV